MQLIRSVQEKPRSWNHGITDWRGEPREPEGEREVEVYLRLSGIPPILYMDYVCSVILFIVVRVPSLGCSAASSIEI